MDDMIEAFVLTNGAETAEYALGCLRKQTVPCKVTVIRNLGLIDAMNECLRRCSSRFFIKVDDDMFLHPRAIEYMKMRLVQTDRPNLSLYCCMLLENWHNRIVESVKAYRFKHCKQIGFKIDHRGKIDRKFLKSCQSLGYRFTKDRSVVGLHALRSVSDQKKYRSLWAASCKSDLKSVDPDQFTIHRNVRDYKAQLAGLSRIPSVNRKTEFGRFLNV